MKTILLTGFEAFGTTPVNPAEKVARHLDGETVEGARIVSSVIPNTFFVCIDAVKSAMAQSGADAVVMMGEFGGRATITVERFALNFNDATRYGLKDNAGVSLQDKPTAPEGPLAYQSTLPLRAMVKAMRRWRYPRRHIRCRRDFLLQSSLLRCFAQLSADEQNDTRRMDPSSASAGSSSNGRQSWCAEHVGRNGRRRSAPCPVGIGETSAGHRRRDLGPSSNLKSARSLQHRSRRKPACSAFGCVVGNTSLQIGRELRDREGECKQHDRDQQLTDNHAFHGTNDTNTHTARYLGQCSPETDLVESLERAGFVSAGQFDQGPSGRCRKNGPSRGNRQGIRGFGADYTLDRSLGVRTTGQSSSR